MRTKCKGSLPFLFPLPLLAGLLLLFLGVAGNKSSDAYQTICNGSVQVCYEEEMLMESEISRRFLAQSKHISYGALSHDQPACGGKKGQSYSKSGRCLPPKSNPKSESCSKIYRCRGGS